MGAPKQKWTSEEEAALKAGIRRYGVGKWSTILKDPDFNPDKWRNLNCMANGLGSRHRASASQKNSPLALKNDEDAASQVENDYLDATPRAAMNEAIENASSGKQTLRLDDLILEAITKLKEARGSSRLTIAEYIEDHHSTPPDFERNLAASLKLLTEKGRLVKVKHQYRIAPRLISSNLEKDPPLFLANGSKKDISEAQRNGIVIITKAQIDAELEKMKSMSATEAAAAAAQAVAEAEAAIAAAEAAATEAEEAEAEAEAARCFADAAQKALSVNVIRVW
ncbi:single myb histone 6 [Phtheirospermum japonicum]|uniref:MYB transcription factor n=1 Tax=Phtheirospermum japonicum TaxID=374723 RepID=A0A830B3X4_9LAMI|nr:single myb histone 6 [Phtheirospermum japonicum]